MTELTSYIDILILGLAIAAIGILGSIILFNDTRSVTNRTFFVFSLGGIVWGILNFTAYQTVNPTTSLWLWRLVMFSAIWFCYWMFRLSFVFPGDTKPPMTTVSRVMLPLAALVSVLTLTPLIFARLAALPIQGRVPQIIIGPLMPLFGAAAGTLIIGSIYHFLVGIKKRSAESRASIFLIIIGTGITFGLLIAFNFLLPTAFNDYDFIPFGGVFILPFVICVAYAIARYRAFNVRLVAVEIFSFTLVIATLLQVLFSSSIYEIMFRISSFLLVLALVILFIRSAIKEMKQREIIEKQARELETVNAQQTNLLHFMSHEIKGYLTKSEAGFAAISQGDFGPVSPDIQNMTELALHEVRKGVRTVTDILEAANLKKGTVTFTKSTFDLKAAVHQIIELLTPAINEKKLTLETTIAWEIPCMVNADEEKVRDHVIRNLIDNAIKYTPTGTIKIEVARTGNVIRFVVQDSGVGITDEDKSRLFTEGGHGKDSIKVNVHSTGYGLFIAKSIVEAQGGKIWAESAGAGKGSRFVVELPAAS